MNYQFSGIALALSDTEKDSSGRSEEDEEEGGSER